MLNKEQKKKLFIETMDLWDRDYKWVIATPNSICGIEDEDTLYRQKAILEQEEVEYQVFSFEQFELYAMSLMD